jgi:MtN3 and saliva related transmembrane protein
MNFLFDALHSAYTFIVHFPAEIASSWAGWTSGEKVGFVAAGFSNIAYIPQFYRIWTTRSARDVSFGMYAFLMTGASIWLVYGLLTEQRPIWVNNCITLCLRGSVLVLKVITDQFRSQKIESKSYKAKKKKTT